jgi:cytosine/creatinine deaminase
MSSRPPETAPDLVLAGGCLAEGRLVDLHVVDGLVAAVLEPGTPVAAGTPREDLSGWLLVGAMAEPHAHLDKALTAEQVPNPRGDLMGAIDAWMTAAAAGMFTPEDIADRATEALELLLANGATAVRTHVNIGAGIEALQAVREARSRMEGLLDVQIVALTSNPITGPEGRENRRALAVALEVGVDLIGGCPHLDPDGTTLMTDAFAAASDAGIGLDLHVDEMLDPEVLYLRELVRMVHDTGFAHPVTASHCVTLGLQSPDVQAAVSREVADAGVSVVTLPQTNLFLQGRNHPTATPRGLTAIEALRQAGALVCAGADNVQDPFNLVGRSDPLETAALLVMAGHRLPDEAFRMIGADARACLGLPSAAPVVGAVADLVAIDAPSVRGAIADAPMARKVFHRGRLVATTSQSRTIYR